MIMSIKRLYIPKIVNCLPIKYRRSGADAFYSKGKQCIRFQRHNVYRTSGIIKSKKKRG